MRKQILSTAMLLAFTTGIIANNTNTITNNTDANMCLEDYSCTRTYTDSQGFSYSATANSCETARRMLLIFVEAE